ncbi:hypothetical protein CFC92_23725 [Salmonella enterica subsp. enterica serovar Infantis]|nr:hypothetical protein [Salmonella enterica]ECA4425288.1 hypothetical protein [Salmonella enterica subsp. enterica serovar Anatum]ECH8994469.1 hypothetical protein [Salmonella enterica subsp. enterica serovar Javiana]ECT9325839.1 hypothetical protein [Salmonella enterica subsp. enterica serovar Infantis]ECU5334838.1 hypothetical protein [Salmonella enterica subsp. enterica serovar Braenderup]
MKVINNYLKQIPFFMALFIFSFFMLFMYVSFIDSVYVLEDRIRTTYVFFSLWLPLLIYSSYKAYRFYKEKG